MGTASLGRRLGDWLGIVIDDDADDDSSAPAVEPLTEHDESHPPRSRPSNAAPMSRVLRFAPTPEFDAEVRTFRLAVSELRAGLEIDDLGRGPA